MKCPKTGLFFKLVKYTMIISIQVIIHLKRAVLDSQSYPLYLYLIDNLTLFVLGGGVNLTPPVVFFT